MASAYENEMQTQISDMGANHWHWKLINFLNVTFANGQQLENVPYEDI